MRAELEVTWLLATDLTGPEIAAHLFVSLNTLRTHTRHIFSRSSTVKTRRAAVTRARAAVFPATDAATWLVAKVHSIGEVRSPRLFLVFSGQPEGEFGTTTSPRERAPCPLPIDRLGRASAVCLAAAGASFASPSRSTTHRWTSTWSEPPYSSVRQTEKTVMTTLALVGIAGLHPRQTVALG